MALSVAHAAIFVLHSVLLVKPIVSDLPHDLVNDMNDFAHAQDRFLYLKRWLSRCGLEGKKIEIKGKRHLLVRFKGPYDTTIKVKTFVSHYDKVPGSPGANDNGAAVFQLLSHAGRLSLSPHHGNCQILFTDGEEVIDGPLSSQGAYQLAAMFKDVGISNCQFYVFDMCGIGNCLALGGAGSVMIEQALKEARISKKFYDEAMNEMTNAAALLKDFQGHNADWIYALFSDDLGFLLNGYPAVFFSTLSMEEASLAHSQWREVFSNPGAMASFKSGYFNPAFQNIMKPLLPQSWQTMHTSEDSIDKLEKRAFILMEDFLTFLTFGKV